MRTYNMKNGEHYSQNEDKLKNAVDKSRKTISEKYGENGLGLKISEEQKIWYAKQKKYIDSLDILSENEVSLFLENKRDLYKGKSGNRKLIRDNPEIFKSLNYHCEKFKINNNNKELPFLCKIDLANNNFKLDDDMLCICKRNIKFNKVTQLWDKFYCVKCRQSPTSVNHFKLKYGDEWEIKWKELRENIPVPRGKNETRLLDQLEKVYNTIIDRNFTVMEFFPDGYSKELNTIYEVNESHHRLPSRRIKDNQRRGMIQHKLKCDFVVIWDDTFDIEIHKYVSKE